MPHVAHICHIWHIWGHICRIWHIWDIYKTKHTKHMHMHNNIISNAAPPAAPPVPTGVVKPATTAATLRGTDPAFRPHEGLNFFRATPPEVVAGSPNARCAQGSPEHLVPTSYQEGTGNAMGLQGASDTATAPVKSGEPRVLTRNGWAV